MKQVKDKDWVKVSYTGRLDSGEVVDSAENTEEPFQFQVGEGQVVQGFDEAMIGMTPGETKFFRLEPEEAYGIRQDEAQLTFQKKQLPEELQDVEIGRILTMVNDDGAQLPGLVVEVNPDSVTIDLNHPLAGHPINFEVELLDVTEPSAH
jgi:peptidylprolyl isomerase